MERDHTRPVLASADSRDETVAGSVCGLACDLRQPVIFLLLSQCFSSTFKPPLLSSVSTFVILCVCLWQSQSVEETPNACIVLELHSLSRRKHSVTRPATYLHSEYFFSKVLKTQIC